MTIIAVKFTKHDLFIALLGPSASPTNIASSESPQMAQRIPLVPPPLVFPPPPPSQGMESTKYILFFFEHSFYYYELNFSVIVIILNLQINLLHAYKISLIRFPLIPVYKESR